MKKIFILAILVLCLGAVGCGSKDSETGSGKAESSNADSGAADEKDATINGGDVEVRDTEDIEGKMDKETEAPAPEKKETETKETEKKDAATETKSDTKTDAAAVDNFSVDKAKVKEYAQKIKDAVVAKNIEQLATLAAYPTYVSIAVTDDSIVKTRDEFMGIGAEAMFTEAFVNAVAGANIDDLAASKAGFVIAGSESGSPSITFGVVNGELGITGINY